MLVADNVEFQTKDKNPATVDLSGFPGDLKITQVKLEHVSGSVTCSQGVPPSFWGCNNQPPATYTQDVSFSTKYYQLNYFLKKNVLKNTYG